MRVPPLALWLACLSRAAGVGSGEQHHFQRCVKICWSLSAEVGLSESLEESSLEHEDGDILLLFCKKEKESLAPETAGLGWETFISSHDLVPAGE